MIAYSVDKTRRWDCISINNLFSISNEWKKMGLEQINDRNFEHRYRNFEHRRLQNNARRV